MEQSSNEVLNIKIENGQSIVLSVIVKGQQSSIYLLNIGGELLLSSTRKIIFYDPNLLIDESGKLVLQDLSISIKVGLPKRYPVRKWVIDVLQESIGTDMELKNKLWILEQDVVNIDIENTIFSLEQIMKNWEEIITVQDGVKVTNQNGFDSSKEAVVVSPTGYYYMYTPFILEARI